MTGFNRTCGKLMILLGGLFLPKPPRQNKIQKTIGILATTSLLHACGQTYYVKLGGSNLQAHQDVLACNSDPECMASKGYTRISEEEYEYFRSQTAFENTSAVAKSKAECKAATANVELTTEEEKQVIEARKSMVALVLTPIIHLIKLEMAISAVRDAKADSLYQDCMTRKGYSKPVVGEYFVKAHVTNEDANQAVAECEVESNGDTTARNICMIFKGYKIVNKEAYEYVLRTGKMPEDSPNPIESE